MVYGLSGNGSDVNSWMHQKNSMSKATIASFIVDKLAVFDRINGLAAKVLSHHMAKMLEESTDPYNPDAPKLDVSDMQKVADIISKIDRIARLESGEATDIIKRVGLSPEEAKQIIKFDPIASTEDIDLAEYKEIYERSLE